MAQARIKKTGEVIDVIPKSNKGIIHMYDPINDNYYTWQDLEPIKVKTGTIPSSVVTTQININPTVTGSITSESK